MLESIESQGLGSILLEAQHLNCIVSLTDIPLPAVQLAIEDESQVEEEASSTPQAQEKKDASPLVSSLPPLLITIEKDARINTPHSK